MHDLPGSERRLPRDAPTRRRRPTPLRVVGWVASGLLALVALAAVAFACWLYTARPQVDGRIRVTGPDAPVRIWRDSLGVPQIWARSETDALFAQGFVHAQDRLWQMELFRRVAQGRLAEVLGADLLPTDRFLRTLGLWRAAGADEAGLEPGERRRLQAYADGVNAFLATRAGALPPELALLGIRPEPWSVRASLAMEKVMAFDLSEYHAGVAVWEAVRRLGPARARFVFPQYPAFGPTIIGAPPAWSGLPMPGWSPGATLARASPSSPMTCIWS